MPVALSLKNGGLRMKFGKFLKKAVKLGSKIARPLLATTPVGRVALRAQQTLKSLGGNLKAARLGKIEPLSVRAGIEKIAPRAPVTRISSIPRSITDVGRFRRLPSLKKRSRMPQVETSHLGRPWTRGGARSWNLGQKQTVVW